MLSDLGGGVGAAASALEIDSTPNAVFDLYFFGNNEAGLFGTSTGVPSLRIGFFLDDASTVGGVMTKSMAGYAVSQTVTTRFEPEYGTKANRYSVAEWAWPSIARFR